MTGGKEPAIGSVSRRTLDGRTEQAGVSTWVMRKCTPISIPTATEVGVPPWTQQPPLREQKLQTFFPRGELHMSKVFTAPCVKQQEPENSPASASRLSTQRRL